MLRPARVSFGPAIFSLLFFAVVLSAGSCSSQRGEGSEPQDCSDGNDNDGDGRVDCADSGCIGAPDCASGDDDTGDDDTGGEDEGDADTGSADD